jgi:hypothetical protein
MSKLNSQLKFCNCEKYNMALTKLYAISFFFQLNALTDLSKGTLS